jgi:hypothetical protein
LKNHVHDQEYAFRNNKNPVKMAKPTSKNHFTEAANTNDRKFLE